MKRLFTIDRNDYDGLSTVTKRPSSRGIIWAEDRLAMVYSKKHGYFKFPGGGIQTGESIVDALIREVQEEAGLLIVEDSIREYGHTISIHKGTENNIFIQDNYYFECTASTTITEQHLDPHESDAGFTLRLIDPKSALEANQRYLETIDSVMI